MPFGQLVIGPPGSGKSTYCRGVQEHFHARRPHARTVHVVNLDPANDALPYTPAVDVSDLVRLPEVMERLKLGPNGALIYCMEFLQQNFDWLCAKLEPLCTDDAYFLFDCPGQVELYTHNDAVKELTQKLDKALKFRLAAVHLVDSHYCSDPAKFISVLLTSLATMLQIELPHVNVLSKIDLIERYGQLAFNLEFYAEVLDLSKLLNHLQDNPFAQRYKKLNTALCGLIEDYSLVTFSTMNIQNPDSITRLMKTIDKANGYVYGGLSEGNDSIFDVAVAADFQYTKFMADNDQMNEFMIGDDDVDEEWD
ncbi:Gpn2 protein [Capsaspora owczarzaki ATCC 30864]|uniref:GPN-loop GTPase 2 n=1 Tax=Capsaspora owczarzaki (strain ATCC 30864) TaxID=595528 RepID=A0A0D2X5Q9_CAPO3|nr:Gpn2 protein [Capsaspora owczarzaki ATCC 30864]KJE98239.1 Gpn2 protein [Capsaspora owczarzaki ATCC 30864]|eukprot:XP_004342487.1 Gpn2 protein [Capsaspora owczarzaki ATCC 30864]